MKLKSHWLDVVQRQKRGRVIDCAWTWKHLPFIMKADLTTAPVKCSINHH